MTFLSFAKHARLLASGDPQAWRYLPYQLKMKRYGVDLRWVSVRDSGLSEERSHWHSNSGGPDLDDLLRTLPISPADKVLDIGCGKGGAMLTLARYPFNRVDGVEISPDLAQIACRNVARLKISHARIFSCDAAEFRDLDVYNYLYMYNPFPEVVMRQVMNNIEHSLERRPRKLTLIYKNPVFSTAVVDAGFTKISETRQIHPDHPPFSVYVSDPTGERARSRN